MWLGIADLERDSLAARGAWDEAEDGVLEGDFMEVEVVEFRQHQYHIRLSKGLRLMRQSPVGVRPGYMLSLSRMSRYPIQLLQVHYLLRIWMLIYCLIWGQLILSCP